MPLYNLGQYGYDITISSHCDRSHREEEQFGSWEEIHSNSFKGIDKSQSPDANCIHDIQVGEVAYVVWVEYSSGDSFGHSEGNYEIIAVLKDFNEAENLAKAIRAHEDSEEYEFLWTSSDGQQVFYGFAPWSGYFEHISDIHVESAIVGKKGRY